MHDSTVKRLTSEERLASLEQFVQDLTAARAANRDTGVVRTTTRRMRKHLPSVVLGAVAAAFLTAAGVAMASRNSAGTYSLATSPVTTFQVITPSLWNNTFGDLAADMTLSLDRNGRGGMLAALRGIDGTLAAPALSFTSETGSGLWRNGAGDVRMSILGALRENWTTTGVAITGTLSATDVVSNSISGTASTNLATFFEASLANTNTARLFVGKATTANNSGLVTYTPQATAANSTWCLDVAGQTSTFCVDGNGKTIIGASGTGIGASKVVTTSITGAAIAGPGCNSNAGTTVSITNIAFGDTCLMSPPAGLGDGRMWTTCTVSAAGTVNVNICSLINITPPTGTYTIRTFQAAN